MTKHSSRTELSQVASLRLPPSLGEATTDRTFELPVGLYIATVGSYLGFLGLMAVTFMTGELVLPMIVFVLYIGMAFGVPTVWARMNPHTSSQALSWQQFKNRGIQTGSGWLSASSATAQVLTLPVLILLWGVAGVIIAASV
ncbi:MAG: hypothetical protein ABI673_08710 [Novosphingobium sp.]